MVPRSERRGLFGRFSLIPEVTNPYDYGNGTKWIMTSIVAFAAATSATGTSIFYRKYFWSVLRCPCKEGNNAAAALILVANDLNTTPTVANMSLAFYLLAMAFMPLWW